MRPSGQHGCAVLWRREEHDAPWLMPLDEGVMTRSSPAAVQPSVTKNHHTVASNTNTAPGH